MHSTNLISEMMCDEQIEPFQDDVYGSGLGRELYRIILPFLPRTTWHEVTEAASFGGSALPTETCEATILWLDIVGFTALLDSHPLGEIILALNSFLDTLTKIVHRHSGDVNKYLGDGFLAVFGSAENAFQCGCALQAAIAEFNRRQLALEKVTFPARIGIDTGLVAIVSLGSCERQDRTVLGMPVNVAQRLQEQAPPGRIWFSQATFERLHDPLASRAVGPIKVRGRLQPLVVYER